MPPVQFDEVISGSRLRAAVVVAHPDDETLWCGGYILAHPEFDWRVVTLCRASDPDRAPKFRRVLEQLGAVGEMADLDDGPDQVPLPIVQVEETIARLLSGDSYTLILTHGPMVPGCLSLRAFTSRLPWTAIRLQWRIYILLRRSTPLSLSATTRPWRPDRRGRFF